MTGAGEISPPERLTPDHDVGAFDSGVAPLDDWLKRRALPNEEAGGSRTFVIGAAGRVVGYYALAAGAERATTATASMPSTGARDSIFSLVIAPSFGGGISGHRARAGPHARGA